MGRPPAGGSPALSGRLGLTAAGQASRKAPLTSTTKAQPPPVSREAALSRLWRIPAPPLLVAVAAAAAYPNSLSGPFVLDDMPSIAANPTIRHLGSALCAPGRHHGGRPADPESFPGGQLRRQRSSVMELPRPATWPSMSGPVWSSSGSSGARSSASMGPLGPAHRLHRRRSSGPCTPCRPSRSPTSSSARSRSSGLFYLLTLYASSGGPRRRGSVPRVVRPVDRGLPPRHGDQGGDGLRRRSSSCSMIERSWPEASARRGIAGRRVYAELG